MMHYIRTTYPDINNGVGCRATIWFSGCSHHCKGCHNEWTWKYGQGKPISELYDEIESMFKKNTYLVGITLSGGDPFSQKNVDLDELLSFVKWFKETFPDKNIWVYSGDKYEDCMMHHIKRDILAYCDVMVDGEFRIEEKDLSLPFRGSKNQRVLDLKKSVNFVEEYKF